MDYVLDAVLFVLLLLFLTANHGGSDALGQFIGGLHPTSERDAEFRRAGGGAGMILLAAVLATHADELLGRNYWQGIRPALIQSIAALWNGMATQLPSVVWVPVGGLLFFILLMIGGVFRLLVGWHRSRGPRDIVAAAKTLIWGSITATLLAGSWNGATWAFIHHDWSITPAVNACLPWLYLWLTVKAAVRLYLELRGMGGGNAARLVERQIEEQSVQWQPGPPRQF